MADMQYRLAGNYYIAWLSRCDDAWRRLLADRGPYVPQHVLKKQHQSDCRQIAKELLREQLHDKMQVKKLGLKSNPGYFKMERRQIDKALDDARKGLKEAQHRNDYAVADIWSGDIVKLEDIYAALWRGNLPLAKQIAKGHGFGAQLPAILKNPGKRHSAGFASRAQQRWAFGTSQSFARRWARKTKFKGLPERVTNMRQRNPEESRSKILAQREKVRLFQGYAAAMSRYIKLSLQDGDAARAQKEVSNLATMAVKVRNAIKNWDYGTLVDAFPGKYPKIERHHRIRTLKPNRGGRRYRRNSRLSKLARSARKRVAIKRMLRRAGHRIPAGIMFQTGALRKYRRRKLGYNAHRRYGSKRRRSRR
jgi:ribosomal protein L29